MSIDETWMLESLKEAKKAYCIDEVPIGAIIVKNNKIISRAHNKKETTKIATAHAEIIAIERACKKLKNWHLDDCTLYVTVEPCLMCAGALIQSRIKKLVYGAPNSKFGYIESIEKILQKKENNHQVEVESGILQKQCAELMKQYFIQKRK